jgi:hypothetical protein
MTEEKGFTVAIAALVKPPTLSSKLYPLDFTLSSSGIGAILGKDFLEALLI